MTANWLGQSIVARRGIGWSNKPHLHDLTEALQGKYHYTIGPYSDPVLTVRPGDRIRVETRDAFEGAIGSIQPCGVHYAANATASLPFAGRKPG
jgi:amidase